MFSLASLSQTYTPTTSPGRVFESLTKPASPPSKFTSADFLYVISDTTTYKWVSNAWTPAYIQIGKPGPKGDKGDKGDTGAQGEPGSGGTGSVNFNQIRFVSTESELRSAVNDWSTGKVTAVYVTKDIGIVSFIEIPHSTTARSRKLIIFLNGCALYDASPLGLPFLIGRHPADQAEADRMQSVAIIIRDGAFIGKSGTGVLVEIGSTYGSVLEAVNLDNANEGVHYRFGLMAMIQSCMATNVGESFIMDNGNWPGAGLSNSQSNSFVRLANRDFGRAGGKSAFSNYGASGGLDMGNIAEGGNKQYGFLVDSKGSSNVRDGRMISSHVEMTPSVAAVKLLLTDGYYIVDGLYKQMASVNVDAESYGGYPHVYVKNWSWQLGGDTWKTKGTNVIWDFDEINSNRDVMNSTVWSGGLIPYYLAQRGLDQAPFFKYRNAAKFVGDVTIVGNETVSGNETVGGNCNLTNLTTNGNVNLNGTVRINSKTPVTQ